MTARGRALFALALAAYGVGWLFGARALSTAAVGLAAVLALAWVSVRLAAGSADLRRSAPPGRVLEGSDVPLLLELRLGGRLPPAAVSLRERFGELQYDVPLVRHGDRYTGEFVVRAAARGRYAMTGTAAHVDDVFGLARHTKLLGTPGSLVVYPRLVVVDTLFSDAGSRWWDGRRLLLRRPAGFQLHAVREYEHGDSLRAVHWRSTARRGELMVKELEDAPRAQASVILDGHAAPAVGRPPDTPFDAAVRAAGSVLLAHMRRGKSARLVLNGARTETIEVASERAWEAALERLAGAEADGGSDVAVLLEGPEASDVPDVTVVTAALSPRLVAALVGRVAARRPVAVVYVDAASFASPGNGSVAVPGLARLASAGVPHAVVRRGADLGAALAGATGAEAVLA